MRKGQLLIISGPSGCGKDTVLKEVFAAEPEIKFSISSITRPMREGEVQDGKYHFISREEFEAMLANNQLLEHNVYLDNYYGTPRKPVETCIENGQDIFVEVDVNGAEKIRKIIPDAISIFILPPSYEVLKKRLSGRGTETPESLQKRLNEALREIKRSPEYDYVVVNDRLEDAVNDVLTIIRADRNTANRQGDVIHKLIEEFE